MSRIAIIVAAATNEVIGKGLQIPWERPSLDTKRFLELTKQFGNVLMGRVTYESIPEKYRPLKNRENVILSRTPGLNFPGCTVVSSLTQAYEVLGGYEWIACIGGAKIYSQVSADASRIYLTRINAEPEGDSFFYYHPRQWQIERREDFPAEGKGPSFSFIDLVRK